MYHYVFHGVQIQSFINLGLAEVCRGIDRDVHALSISRTHTQDHDWGSPVWESPFSFEDGVPHARLFQPEDGYLLEIPPAGWFLLHEDRIEVGVRHLPALPPYLLGRVFALWMQLRGALILHGATVSFGDSAVAVVGQSGAGKSTLSSALVQAGHPLVTDDLIPLDLNDADLMVAPGIPFSRLWPDTLTHLGQDLDALPRVHPAEEKRKVDDPKRFLGKSLPLKAIYILERIPADQTLEIVPQSGARALMDVLANTYRPEPLGALGRHGALMSDVGKLVARLPVLRLRYPTGFNHLQSAVSALQEDVHRRTASPRSTAS